LLRTPATASTRRAQRSAAARVVDPSPKEILMAYRVPAAATVVGGPHTVVNVVNAMAAPMPPANISFPLLGNPPATNSLGPGQGMVIAAGAVPQVNRSIGLITCASVCYVNTANNTGYVYHANAGDVPHGDFVTAMGAIGAVPPYGTVYIAYAHPNATDQGYQQSIQDFVNWGVPTNQIVEITHLFVGQFGTNNQLQIGY
jgi:hypothetical protein